MSGEACYLVDGLLVSLVAALNAWNLHRTRSIEQAVEKLPRRSTDVERGQ